MSLFEKRRKKRCEAGKHLWGLRLGQEWLPLSRFHKNTRRIDHLIECKYCGQKKKQVTPPSWIGPFPTGTSNPKMTIEYKAIIL